MNSNGLTDMRLGLLGGTFDPPHFAHLILAQHAFEELELDRVLFIPAGDPPHKSTTRTYVGHRVAMLNLAISDDTRFTMSRVDIDRPGPHYTIDTVRIIHQQYPEATLFFIMGGDTYRDLVNWNNPQQLFTTARLAVAVMRRPGSTNNDLRLDMHHNVIPELEANALMLDSPLVEISSTDIVQRIMQGKSVRYMLPDSVINYIQDHNLYRKS